MQRQTLRLAANVGRTRLLMFEYPGSFDPGVGPGHAGVLAVRHFRQVQALRDFRQVQALRAAYRNVMVCPTLASGWLRPR